MRTVLIGDIHGCFQEWKELLEKIQFDSTSDCLILLGDLMDRGKDSYRVFSKAVGLQREMGDRFVLLKGSHEKMLFDKQKNLQNRILWRLTGKGATIRSFRSHGENMYTSIAWFEKHCVPFYESEDFQCVHAGIKYEKLADNDEHTLTMDHRWTRKNLYSGKLTITGHIHLKEPTWFDGSGENGQSLEYHKWMSLPQVGTICIDTGCAEGNKLTAMIINADRFYLEYVKLSKKPRAI